MTRLRGFAVLASALLLAAAPAAAATVTWPDGKQEPLEIGREVAGPAVVAAADGKDTIRLRPGAILRDLGKETDEKGNQSESFFLKSGAADLEVGFFTRLATPAFWAFPENRERRAAFHLATFPGKRSYARAAKGSGLVRLLLDPGENGNREVHLLGGQGVLLAAEKEGVRFATDADNEYGEGMVRLIHPLAKGRVLEVYLPKATEGAVLAAGDRVLAANGLSSWRRGRILLAASADGKVVTRGFLSPGVAVTLDPATGQLAPWSEAMTKAAAPLLLLPAAGVPAGGLVRPAEGAAVRVLSLRMEAGANGPRARLVLRNDGGTLDSFAGEVAFLLPAPPESSAPFFSVFAPVETAAWKTGEERTLSADCPVAGVREPLDILLLSLAGPNVPAPATGTRFLGGRVKVAELATDLLGDKPWIELAIENTDPAEADTPLGEIRYELAFWRDGKPVAGGTSTGASKPLGRRGERVVLRIDGLPGEASLAGAWPVLTLLR